MPWFLYTWFSIVAFEVVPAYKIKNNKQWCDAQNFLAQIKKTKKQYRVFDQRNIEMDSWGVLLSEAEEICKNMTMCYHCILPEPKDEEENKVLIQLAEHCNAKPYFLGVESNSQPPKLRWRSDNSTVDVFKPIYCVWPNGDEPCYQMIDSSWCEVNCETKRSREIICEMKPSVPGLQVSTGPNILKPPCRDPPSPVPDTDRPSSGSEATELSVLTIVAIAVGSLGWLLLLCAVCVYCFYSSRKRTNQNRENTAQNVGQCQPVIRSEPQTLQSPGNISEATFTEPAYTQGQPGSVYSQAPPSQSTPSPANTDVQQASGSSVFPEPHNQKRVTRTVS